MPILIILKAMEITRYLKEISGLVDELFAVLSGNEQVSIYSSCCFEKAKKSHAEIIPAWLKNKIKLW
jgi:hypothetical protein